MKFDRWPFGINPYMDKHAAEYGLSHWSCVNPSSNDWWVRKDGSSHLVRFDKFGGYVGELRKIDRDDPLIEEKPAGSASHSAYVQYDDHSGLKVELDGYVYTINADWIPPEHKEWFLHVWANIVESAYHNGREQTKKEIRKLIKALADF